MRFTLSVILVVALAALLSADVGAFQLVHQATSHGDLWFKVGVGALVLGSSVFTGYLSDNIKITVEAPTAAGTSAINSTALDMAGFDGVLWVVRLGTPAANNNIRAQQDIVVGMGGAADLAGTLVNSATNNVHALDLQKPAEQFVRCQVTRGTSTTIDQVIAIQYKARSLPVAQAAAITLEQWSSPAEGTA